MLRTTTMSRFAHTPEPSDLHDLHELGDTARKLPNGPVNRIDAAVAGLAAAAVGLGAAELAASLSPGWSSPIISVGDRVVDLVPSPIKELGIALFGTGDKVALLVGVALVVTAYAMAVGVVALRRSRRLGLAGVALFGAVGCVAAVASRTGFAPLAAVPSIVGAGVAAVALDTLGRLATPAPLACDEDEGGRQPPPAPTPAASAHPGARRRMLAGAGAALVGAAVLGTVGRRLDRRLDPTAGAAARALPTPSQPLAPVPASAQVEGAATFLTANRDFYRIDTALALPRVDADRWRLTVRGLVNDELELSYQDLIEGDLIERDITLTCVSNTVGGELIGTARWLGVRLDDLLEQTGIDAAADQIVGRSVDGYTCGFPVAALDGRDALVAIGMNGEPLPVAHGFPARLIVPGIYGYASATKWLAEIELTTFAAFDHYWVPRGYAAKAPIKLQSRIDTPRGLDRIRAGTTAIAGVAWAQTVGIGAVEVRIDDGAWQPASLATDVGPDTWRQWSLPWAATPGRHTVSVRAIDRSGAIQTADRSEPLPDGASGHHTVVVLVDEV